MRFDESKVINSLHVDEAKLGEKYFFADTLAVLKLKVEKNKIQDVETLVRIENNPSFPFQSYDNWSLIYPYEKNSGELMTNRQLAEWLAKGNGQYKSGANGKCKYSEYSVFEDDEIVSDDILVRKWKEDDWIKPTVTLYEKDCVYHEYDMDDYE